MSQSSIQLLQKMLDYTAARGKVINKNIANVNTEGYQREDMSFGEVMNEVQNSTMKVTRPDHMSIEKKEENGFQVEADSDMSDNTGVNNVQIDQEMAQLAENTILFKFAARKANGYFTTLQTVIKGGRR